MKKIAEPEEGEYGPRAVIYTGPPTYGGPVLRRLRDKL